jgi:hypothetical protein
VTVGELIWLWLFKKLLCVVSCENELRKLKVIWVEIIVNIKKFKFKSKFQKSLNFEFEYSLNFKFYKLLNFEFEN